MSTMIVINDEDGHCHVFPCNQETVRDLLKMAIAADEINTRFIDGPDEAQHLLNNNASMEEMVNYMEGEITGRSCGGFVHFVEVKENLPAQTLW